MANVPAEVYKSAPSGAAYGLGSGMWGPTAERPQPCGELLGCDYYDTTTGNNYRCIFDDTAGFQWQQVASSFPVFNATDRIVVNSITNDIVTPLGDINDWSPTNFSTKNVIRMDSNASVNITGLVGGADGRLVYVFNVSGAGVNLTFKNEGGGSTAANRFALGTDLVLAPERGTIFWYDATDSRWRAIEA